MEFEEAQHAKSKGKKKGKGKKKKVTNTYKASMVDEYSDVE